MTPYRPQTFFTHRHRHFRACNPACAEAFKNDRDRHLIYGPYMRREGGFYQHAEQWSMAERHCAYCCKPIIHD